MQQTPVLLKLTSPSFWQKKIKNTMKFESGHLLNHCWEQPQRNAVSSPTTRTRLLVFRRHCSATSWKQKGSSIWGALVWNLLLQSVGVQYDLVGCGVGWVWIRQDVIPAEVSPSSQSCGLVRAWGGGWEGPLTARPPCLPAPHRSRSPGRGSKDQTQELIVIF